MIALNRKYVFHIPLYKHVSGNLIRIEMEDILDELISQFNESGFESLYITKINSYYKKRQFDEMIITIFSNDDLPCEIFGEWFRKNNDVLRQEAFAYEIGNTMVINDLHLGDLDER